MIEIILIILILLGIFFNFCVIDSEYTFLGRLKQKLISTIQLINIYIPQVIKSPISKIFMYVFFKRNPIVQVKFNKFIL